MREGADLDVEAILQAAAETGTIIEINVYPERLDLPDVYVRRAVELGVGPPGLGDAGRRGQYLGCGRGSGPAGHRALVTWRMTLGCRMISTGCWIKDSGTPGAFEALGVLRS